MYNSENIFAKILRGEIPAEKIYEDEYCIAAKIHVLVIPKFEAMSFNDFVQNAKSDFVSNFFRSVQKVASHLGLEEDGYRVIHNHGENGNQTVFHFHVHILGGQKLGGF